MSFKMFAWVPDGVYDSAYYCVRYSVLNGNPHKVITKTWLDEGGPAELDDHLKLSWGSYPDMPPKPAKK